MEEEQNEEKIYGPKLFTYDNGDTYKGEYVVDFSKKIVFRHGKGTYKTHNNVYFNGIWNYDKIMGEVEIKFHDGAIYKGEIDSSSPRFTFGTFHFPDKSYLFGNFKNISDYKGQLNELNYTDPNGKMWIPFYEKNKINLKYHWNADNNENLKDDKDLKNEIVIDTAK